MRKALWALAAALGLLALLLGLGVLWLGRTLRSPELKTAVLERVRAAAGTDVRVRSVEVSLLSGVRLAGIEVANPTPFHGELMTAEAFVLRYELLALLAGRFHVSRLSLERPQLAVTMDARGLLNVERLGAQAVPARRPPAAADAAPPRGSAAALPLRIVLSRLSIEDAALTMTDHTGSRLFTIEGADFASALDVSGGRVSGSGTAAIGTLNVAGARVQELTAPLRVTPDSLTLEPVRGALAGGRLAGRVVVHFRQGFRYGASIELRGARVAALLEQTGSRASLTGTLEGNAEVEGSGGLLTVRANGQGRVADCRLKDSRALRLVSTVLGVPELANPDFDECRAEFRQSGHAFRTPVLRLKGDAVEVAGRGTLDLATSGLDYDLTLALSPRLFAKVTRQELRGAFRTRDDGFATIDFRLTGTTLEPRTDLLSRIARGAAQKALTDRVRSLFGGERRR